MLRPIGGAAWICAGIIPRMAGCLGAWRFGTVEDCSEVREPPGLGVEEGSVVGDLLSGDESSEVGGSPGLGVGDCAVLRNSVPHEDCSELGHLLEHVGPALAYQG